MTPQDTQARIAKEIKAREAHKRCMELEIASLKAYASSLEKDSHLITAAEVLFGNLVSGDPPEPDGRCPWRHDLSRRRA